MLLTTDILKQIKKEFDSERLTHAYLLNGTTSDCYDIVKSIILDIQDSEKIDQIDNIFCFDDDNKFGVEELRKIQNQLFVSSNSKFKILYLENIERLSLAALNSILKILEEPPRNVVFFLTTNNMNNVLETIISRCRCYELNKREEENLTEVENVLDGLKQVSDIFGFVEQLKTREDATNWVNTLQAYLRHKLKYDYSSDYADMLILCQKSINDIAKNVNFRLVIEVLLLRVLEVESRINSKF